MSEYACKVCEALSTTRVVTLPCGTCVFAREGQAAMGHDPNRIVCQVCAGTGKVKAAMPGYTFMGAKTTDYCRVCGESPSSGRHQITSGIQGAHSYLPRNDGPF